MLNFPEGINLYIKNTLNINSQSYEFYADYQEYLVSTDIVAISHAELTHPQPIPLRLLWQQAVVFFQTEVFFCNLQTICIRSSLYTPTTSSMSNRGPQELDASWLDAIFKLSKF